MKILVVDDEPINVYLLENLLKKKYEISTAENGLIAYNQILKEPPDLILLDVMMPYMNGFELLEKIKSNGQIGDIAVIMITAKVEKEDVKKALTLGANDYIKKPVDTTELYSKIDLQLKLKSKQKKIDEYQVYANIHESMILAQRIQKSLLPDNINFNRLFPDSFFLYIPKDMVSGDFYFTSEILGKKFICVYDSTGHGVPAAMISLMGYMILNWIVNKEKFTDPLTVALKMREELIYHLSKTTDTYAQINGMDAIICEFDVRTNILKFVGAKRPVIIVRYQKDYIVINGKTINPSFEKNNYFLFYIRGDLNSINIETFLDDFTERKIELDSNDRVYMFSDGYTDQFGGTKSKKFSKKQLFGIILDIQNKSLKQQKLTLYNKFADWAINHEQTDDIVLVGISV